MLLAQRGRLGWAQAFVVPIQSLKEGLMKSDGRVKETLFLLYLSLHLRGAFGWWR